MDILLRNARIVDANSPHHLSTLDVWISGHFIQQIGKDLSPANARVVDIPGLHISPGWVDMMARFGEPGFEYKETFKTGTAAAAAGGFTHVALMPSTDPVVDNAAQVEYVRKYSAGLPAQILPVGALTVGRAGGEMAELMDMHQAGAIAFSDDKRAVVNPKLLELAATYAAGFDGLVMHFPDTPEITRKGMMHEGDVSVFLGLKGIPAFAEEMGLSRDLYLADYAGVRMHFSLVSLAASIALLRQAKQKISDISAGIAAHYLWFSDQVMEGFDAIHKVKPPYRTETDIQGMIEGLKDGTIDVICSDHTPEDTENKISELEQAAFGISSIETVFSVACTRLLPHMDIETIIAKLSANPRRILRLPPATIQEGAEADLSFFDPHLAWKFEKSVSKGINQPFIGTDFTGKVWGTYSDGKLRLT